MQSPSPLNVPTISVCIPTYRGAIHLDAAIESVLNQDFTDLELIVIDDNSPDNTYEVVSQYQDPRLRYLKNPSNLGPEGNWNRCLTEAKGKYFKLLPQDDILSKDCLSRQIDILERDTEESIALVFCARHIIDANGKIMAKRGYRQRPEGVIPGIAAIKDSIRWGTNLIGEPGAVTFRRALAEKTGNFDGSISYIIDLDYWFRLLLNGDAYYIASPLSSFRVASGSWSIDIGDRQSEDYKRFIDRCFRNHAYKLEMLDCALGYITATINNYLRLLFYKFLALR